MSTSRDPDGGPLAARCSWCNGDFSPIDYHARLLTMPIPSLRSTGGSRSEFYCSACNTKMAIQEEWDNHLSSVHPRHWEREKKERATSQASRKLSATRWCVTIAFSVLGF